MAECVVHALEAVEIDEEHRDLGTAPSHAREPAVEMFEQHRPARQAREPIVRRVVLEPLGEPVLFCDVFDLTDDVER